MKSTIYIRYNERIVLVTIVLNTAFIFFGES